MTAAYTVVLFVAWDLSKYVLHRLAHQVPALWALHKVHHSAEVMTPLTFYRTHPLESLLFDLRGALVTGVVTGGFFWAFRGAAEPLYLLGVNVLGFAFNFFGGNLRHSHVWLSYPAWAERWFISPSQHQLHHTHECERNYGAWLAIWDRMGGSLDLSGARRILDFGLPEGELNHAPDDLLGALVGPVVELLRRLRPQAVGLATLLLVVPVYAAEADAPADEGSAEDNREDQDADGDEPEEQDGDTPSTSYTVEIVDKRGGLPRCPASTCAVRTATACAPTSACGARTPTAQPR